MWLLIQPSLLLFTPLNFTFLLAANDKHVPEFKVLDIGLDKTFAYNIGSGYNYITGATIQSFFHKRARFFCIKALMAMPCFAPAVTAKWAPPF